MTTPEPTELPTDLPDAFPKNSAPSPASRTDASGEAARPTPRERLLRGFRSPLFLGAAYMVALTAFAGYGGLEDDSDLGKNAHAIADFVSTQFGPEVRRIALSLGAVAVSMGLVLGLVAGALRDLRWKLHGITTTKKRNEVAELLTVVATLHAAILAYAMAKMPQLYVASFYAKGGLPRLLQLLTTDVLGRPGVLFLSLLAVLGYLQHDPRKWKESLLKIREMLPKQYWKFSAPAAALLALAGIESGSSRTVTVENTVAAIVPVRNAHAAAAEAPMVVVLAADSLRADRFNATTMPKTWAFFQQGTRFPAAYVSLPRTFPSWVTWLTGRHPHHHGIRSMFPTWADREKDFDALPGRLEKQGFKTAVSSDYAGDIFSRIDLGFSRVDTPTFDFRELVRQRALERETPLLPLLHSRTGRSLFPVLREMNDAADPFFLAKDAIQTSDRSGTGPQFLTVFFSTAHFPYAAPAPYYSMYTDAGYRGPFKYHRPRGLGNEGEPTPEDVKQIRGLYDGAVRAIDDAFAEILKDLEARGRLQNAWVVLTADHGEALYEGQGPGESPTAGTKGHGIGHGDHLFGDEALHVPFAIRGPGIPAGENPAMVRDVDLAPTLYELTKTAAPSDLDGRSLVPVLAAGKETAKEPVYAFAETGLWFTDEISALGPGLRLPYPGITGLTEVDREHGDDIVLRASYRPLAMTAKHRAIFDGRFKLVYVPTRDGARYMLFDRQTDPAEVRDVASEKPEERKRLATPLWAWMLRDTEMEERGGFLVHKGQR